MNCTYRRHMNLAVRVAWIVLILPVRVGRGPSLSLHRRCLPLSTWDPSLKAEVETTFVMANLLALPTRWWGSQLVVMCSPSLLLLLSLKQCRWVRVLIFALTINTHTHTHTKHFSGNWYKELTPKVQNACFFFFMLFSGNCFWEPPSIHKLLGDSSLMQPPLKV